MSQAKPIDRVAIRSSTVAAKIPPALHKRIKKLAELRGMKMKAIVANALEKWADAQEVGK